MDVAARGKLRIARTSRGLSLRELARRVGVSASLLSQVENGKSDPSVSTLYALVAELGLSLDTLLDEATTPVALPKGAGGPGGSGATIPPGRPPSTAPVIHGPERRVLLMDSGVAWERLTRGPSDVLDALLVTYDPGGSSSSSGRLMTHGGREFAFLMSGQLTLQLAFETYTVEAGDSLEFESSTPHLYVNSGSVPAIGIWYVLGQQLVPTQEQLVHIMSAKGGRA